MIPGTRNKLFGGYFNVTSKKNMGSRKDPETLETQQGGRNW